MTHYNFSTVIRNFFVIPPILKESPHSRRRVLQVMISGYQIFIAFKLRQKNVLKLVKSYNFLQKNKNTADLGARKSPKAVNSAFGLDIIFALRL